MLAQEEYVEVHALRRRGWSISAIARHLGRDRKTVRAHLLGERALGERRPAEGDPFDETFGGLCCSMRRRLWGMGRAIRLSFARSGTAGCDRCVGRVRQPGAGRLRSSIIHPGWSASRCWVELRDTP